ncbi:MAG: RNA pseudouridine synthase [Bacteriovoracaceae bacterium]|nr:RNA pseudouridine synthase [Bacteriovoracaceae bacterium]
MKAGICFLESFPNLYEAMSSISSVTKSQVKKLGEKKKFWELPVNKGDCKNISLDAINYLKINPVCDRDVKVLEETSDFIVLSKPYSCHSHPLSYSDSNNVLSFVRSQWPDQVLEVNSQNYDRGLLYRLDYETSGLLIYCKKDFLHKELRDSFSTLVKEKTYYAIVQGNFASCSLTHKIVYGGVKGSKAQAMDVSHTEGITATLEAKRVEHNAQKDLTLLQIKLKEGHRHQIRVQLAAEGVPILGDTLYGANPSDRLFLHCYSYIVGGNTYQDPNLELFELFFNLNS